MGSCRSLITLPKTCQRCGVEFGCGGSCCWCDEVPLDAAVREQLQQQFSDCLCRACLETAARDREVPTVPKVPKVPQGA
jgi:hypothetical protein